MVNEALLHKLKSTAPAKVRVYTADDEHRDVAVPNRRRRWTTVLETVDRIPWVRCELLDKGGDVLAIVDNDGPAGEPEDLNAPSGSARMAELRALMELMLRGQREALSFRDSETKALLQMQVEVLKSVTIANSELAKVFRMTTQAVGMGARAAAEAEMAGKGGDEADELAVKMLGKMLSADDEPRIRGPVNGHRKRVKRKRTDGGTAGEAD